MAGKINLTENKVETEEFIKAFTKLPDDKKERIYYMIQGYEFLSQTKKPMMASGM